MTKVGSSPPSARTLATRLVVVVANVGRVMPDKNGGALRLEPFDCGIATKVGSLHLVTEAQHHLRNAGHAGTTNADEMHAVDATHAFDHVVAPAASRQ